MRIHISGDARLVDARDHTARLLRLIVRDVGIRESPLGDRSWDAVATPLQFAASIFEVKVDTSFVDDTGSVLYCSSAADFDDAQSQLNSVYVEEVTKFVWVWMALEKAIDTLCDSPRRDRIGAAVKFVKEEGARIPFFGLSEAENETYVKTPAAIRDDLKRHTKTLVQKVPRELSFLYLCREARNCLLHGNADMPITYDWDPNGTDWYEGNEGVVWVRSLERLGLFGLQSILYAAFHNSTHRTSTIMTSDGVPEGVLVHEALQVLHLNEGDYVINENQRGLFESDSV